MADEKDPPTQDDDKLELLVDKMIEDNSTDSEAAKSIKRIIRDIMNEDHGDEDNKDLYRVIQQITNVLSGLDHQDYPYAIIANEEITNIYNILYPNEEEGEEY